MQSALGRVLLTKLAARVNLRRQFASILDEQFSRIPGVRVAVPGPEFKHAYYKYYAFVEPGAVKRSWNRDRMLQAMLAEGVPCFSGSCSEIYLEKAFSQKQRPPQRLPVARELGETSLMFHVHSTLTEKDMFDTAAALEKVMLSAVKPTGRTQAIAAD
jgi:hypothetical protein